MTTRKRKPSKTSVIRQAWNWGIKNPWPVIVAFITSVFTLFGGIKDIVEFIKRWPDDKIIIISTILGLLYITLLIFLTYFLAYKPSKSKRRSRLVAFICLAFLIALPFAVWRYTILQGEMLDKKVIILVADFDGPLPNNYRVTEQILSQLRQLTTPYEDTLVIPLGRAITEQEGSEKARILGQNYHGDVLIWGWYGVTESNALTTINIENLSHCGACQPLASSETKSEQFSIAEFDSYKVQQRLSDQMSALTLLVMATVRYEAADYTGSIPLLNKALESGEWPELQSNIYTELGFAYWMSEENLKAIDSFDKALSLNLQNDLAFTGRGSVYFDINENLKAIDDFSQAILLNSESATAYFGRGSAYAELGQRDKAIADLRRAVEITDVIKPYVQLVLMRYYGLNE